MTYIQTENQSLTNTFPPPTIGEGAAPEAAS